MQAYVPPKLRQIVAEAVFRRKKLVVITVISVCSLALAGTLAMHQKFQASAKLLVQNVRTAAQLTTSNVDHLVSQGDVSPSEINTEVDLLESDGVARRALGRQQEQTTSAREDRLVRRFKQLLSVQAVHQTDVIDLKMLGNTPQEARANLQRVIDAYFEERAGTASNSGAAEFFDRQLQEKTNQLNADQAALTAFDLQHGISDLDDQTKLQVARVSTLQDQLAQIEASLAAARNKIAAERQELASIPARSQTQVKTITNQYSQERLNTALVDLQNRRTELLKRYVPTDRQVIEIDEKISTTRKAVNEAAAHPAAEEATDVNPVWVQLTTDLSSLSAEVSGLEGQRTAVEDHIRAAQMRLNELEQSAIGYGDLRRKLQQSLADYTLYAQRRDEARISEALDRQKLFNVAVMQAPIASAEAVRPKPLLYMSSAFTFALLLGVSFAVYADLAGGQVYTPAQLDAWTNTRTWATFADEGATDAKEPNRRQLRRVLFSIRQAVANRRAALGGQQNFTPADGRERALPANVVEYGLCVAFTSATQGEGVSFLVSGLADEGARHSAARVAVLDMRALLDVSELGEGERLPLQLESGAGHWVLSSHATRRAIAASERKPQFAFRLNSVLQQVRQEFDLVLLDCPSLQTSTLAAELAPCVDGYVSVVKAGAARKHNIEDLLSHLSSTSAPVLGQVLNRRIYPVPRWLHKII